MLQRKQSTTNFFARITYIFDQVGYKVEHLAKPVWNYGNFHNNLYIDPVF